MAVTDSEVLTEIYAHCLEDGSGVGPIWTEEEILNYLNNRQQQLLKDSLCLLKREAIVTTPNVTRQPLPADCIAIAEMAWLGADGVSREVPRADSMDADMNLTTWELEQGTRPLLYSDTEVPQLEVEIAPGPSQPGVLTPLYAYLGTVLTGAGDALTVFDELAPAVKWGAIADMLSKNGRGQDLVRAAYAEDRYQEGAAAVLVMLNGFD